MVKTLKRRNQSVAGDKLSSHRRESKSQQPEVNQVKGTEETGVRQKKVRFSTAHELPTTTTFTPEASAGVKLLDPIPLTTSERQPTNKNTTTSKYKTATEAPTTKIDDTTKIRESNYLQPTSTKYRAIRYNGLIETTHSEKPFQNFIFLFKEYFRIIQEVLGKDVYIASWNQEQDPQFPPLKTPGSIPKTRESIGIYLGTYVNPKRDGSRVFLNLRLVTYKPHQVPLAKFGTELEGPISLSKHKMSIRSQPRPCQAARSTCIGWLMYSCKSMNSETFLPALKEALNIPDEVAIGVQYRAISDENGKRPAFDKDQTNAPASAIHLEIDARFAIVYQSRASSLWKYNSKKRMPNGIQLRLVPCFTSFTGKSMTENQRSDAKTMKERQFYFVNEHLKVIRSCNFISQLDTPIDDDNPMTLRRAMMSRAPANKPTNRLIHNVDARWKRPSEHIVTSVVGRDTEAIEFLENMIPEFLHRFGDGASKWFTEAGLRLHKKIKGNAAKGTTSSAKEFDSEEMVQEDVWYLADKWKELRSKSTDSNRPETSGLDKTQVFDTASTAAPTETTAPTETKNQDVTSRLASDKSNASFENVYQLPLDAAEALEVEAQATEMAIDHTGTEIEFSAEQPERNREKGLESPPSTGFSMSTAGKTTTGTRLKLKEAREEIKEAQEYKKKAQEDEKKAQEDETKAQAEIEQLRRDLAKYAAMNPPESSFDTPLSSNTNTYDTQELANRLSTHVYKSTTEHLSQTDELSVSSKDLADPQDIGYKSGSRRAHPPSEDPQGIAGDLTEAAGHSV